jgi:hypothetical protein
VDYLFWWVKAQQAPPLIAIGPVDSPTVVVGGDKLAFDASERSGVRASFGAWLNTCETLGFEASFLTLFQGTRHVTVGPSDTTTIIRPFIDATTNLPSGLVLAVPGAQTASSSVETFSQLWTVEANLRAELWRFAGGHVDLLGGFRYLELNEHLQVDDRIQVQPVPVFLSGATIIGQDFFGTGNSFYGGQVGLEGQLQFGRFYTDLWGKVAMGNDHQTVIINGSTVILNPPNALDNFNGNGNVLAQASNSGHFEHNHFAIIPEAGVKIGMRLTDYLRIGAGYSFLYINRVARPGNQIDTTVNPAQIPQQMQAGTNGTGRPIFLLHETDYWAHGVSLELEYRF